MVGETSILSDQQPIMLYDGDLIMHGNTGKLSSITLTTHKNNPTLNVDEQLNLLIGMQKFVSAFDLCKQFDEKEKWCKLGEAAITNMDIHFGK
jgi:WD repeat-containing protein 19